MNPLQALSTIPAADWPALHRRAIACGCGQAAHPDAERLAAADELVAVAVPELVRLGVLALVADGGPRPPRECASALSCAAATVLRLLDRALAAHGRDTGYAVDAWLERVFECAHARAGVVSRLEPDRLPLGLLVEASKPDWLPLGLLVEASAEAAADVVTSLHRDRLGVPEGLADALASLLVLYAAGTAMGG
jgi:hypothetical protein